MNRIVISAAIAFVSLGGCSGFSSGPTSGNTPIEMFEHLIASPVPDSITNLQGVGDTWQGYSIYLRFKTTPEWLTEIVVDGYELTSCSDIAYRFELPNGYDEFDPPWSPLGVDSPQCYEAKVTNAWTHGGTHYIIFEPEANTVHFYGVGA